MKKAQDRAMSRTTFVEYLRERGATTDYTRALGEVVMLRGCGARSQAN